MFKNKIPTSLAQSYQDYIEPEKIRGVRVMCILGFVLYLAFLFVDIFSLSSKLHTAWVIRVVVITGFLASFALTYSKYFLKYYNFIQPAPYLFAALGINLMIYISDPTDTAYDVYFAGLLLVISVLFSWSHTKLLNLFTISIIIISSYIGVLISHYGGNYSLLLPVLFPNLSFLISASIIGVVSSLIRDQYLYKNFSLQQSLQIDLEQKTIESKDNAYLANHDALTALPNRRYMTEKLERSLQIAKKKDKILAILFFDLNGFKQVNDIYGHAVGDEVLVIVAKRLELTIRKGDHVARLAGDEFLVGLMIDREHVSEVDTMAEKFTALLSEPMHIDGDIVNVGASVGIAAYPINGNDINVLIDIADKKMYNIKESLQKFAKEHDKNKKSEAVVVFPSNSRSRH